MALADEWPTYTDDTGTKTDGTIINESLLDDILAAIEAIVESTNNPSEVAADIIDEVVDARGSMGSLDARLDVALEEDGTPKAVAGQATQTQVGRQQGAENLLRNGDMHLWGLNDAVAPDYWVLGGAGAAVERAGLDTFGADTQDVGAGQSSAKLTSAAAGLTFETSVIIPGDYSSRDAIEGRTVVFSVLVKTSSPSAVNLVLDDGISQTASAFHSGGGAIELLKVKKTLSSSSTELTATILVAASAVVAYVGGAQVIVSDIEHDLWIPDQSPWQKGGRVDTWVGTSNTSGTGETDLWTIRNGVIPGGGIGAAGARTRIMVWGIASATAAARSLKLYIGAQSVDILTWNSAAVTRWNMYMDLVRISDNAVRIIGYTVFGASGASGSVAATFNIHQTGASLGSLDFTVDNLMKLTGTAAAGSFGMVHVVLDHHI